MRMTQPKYRHDCAQCHYIGDRREDGKVGDGYLHEYRGTWWIIVQFSDVPSDYSCEPCEPCSDEEVAQ